jgi:hypothetical protein
MSLYPESRDHLDSTPMNPLPAALVSGKTKPQGLVDEICPSGGEGFFAVHFGVHSTRSARLALPADVILLTSG